MTTKLGKITGILVAALVTAFAALALWGVSASSAATTCTGTQIRPTDDIDAVINAAPDDGSEARPKVFCILDGVHVPSQRIEPKSYQHFVGVSTDGTDPVIDGRGAVDYVFHTSSTTNLLFDDLVIRGADRPGTVDCRPDCGRGIGGGGELVTVRNSRITANGNAGIGGMGKGLLVNNSVIDNNGFNDYFHTVGQSVSAAGIKNTNAFTVRNSTMRNNEWNGIRIDAREGAVTQGPLVVENSAILDNGKTGVSVEITESPTSPSRIANNTIQGNGFTTLTDNRKAEVLIGSANDVEVTGNTFGDTAKNAGNLSDLGVLVYEDSREPVLRPGSIKVYSNTETGGGATDIYRCSNAGVVNCN